jgi:hypothetical protein
MTFGRWRAHLTKVVVGTAVVGIAVALAVILLYQGVVRFNYPTHQEFPTAGVYPG